MNDVRSHFRAYHPIVVVAAVVGVAVPAAGLTLLANSIGKDGPDFPELHWGVLGAASLAGLGVYFLSLRIDPNVPRAALVPAVLASLITSVIGFVVSCICFIK